VGTQKVQGEIAASAKAMEIHYYSGSDRDHRSFRMELRVVLDGVVQEDQQSQYRELSPG
jgi:hypothetical protein